MKRVRIGELFSTEKTGQNVTVMGWVRTRRDSKGGFSFIEVNDGSCLANLQVIADDGLPNYKEEILKLQTGCSVKIKGTVIPSQGKGQKVELRAEEIHVMGWSDPDSYPLQKKRHSFEFLRTIAHLRPRTNTFGAIARVRNAMSVAIHRFFQEKGFLYIHTPIITGSDCEGAGAMFKVTTLDLIVSLKRTVAWILRRTFLEALPILQSADSLRRRSMPLPWEMSIHSARHSGPKTRTRRVICQNSGWWSLRWPSVIWTEILNWRLSSLNIY